MRIDKRKSKTARNGYVYRVRIDYTDEYGIRSTYTKSGFKTKKEAIDHGHEMETRFASNDFLETKKVATLSDCLLEAMELQKDSLSRNTWIHYMNVFNNHIKGTKIASCPVSKLNYNLIQRHFNTLADQSKSMVDTQKSLFSKALIHARRCGYITQNPMPLIELKFKEPEEEKEDILSYSDLERIIDYMIEPRPNKIQFNGYSYAVATYIGYYLGLRIGEILALEKEDFDLDGGFVEVHRKVESIALRKKDQFATERMKTKGSKAKLPVPKPLIEILEAWFAYDPFDLVCPDANGDYILQAVYRKHCRKAGDKIGIDFHPHLLRHTYVSMIVASGADIKTASKLARHSNIQTTLQVYTHSSDQSKKDVVDKVFC